MITLIETETENKCSSTNGLCTLLGSIRQKRDNILKIFFFYLAILQRRVTSLRNYWLRWICSFIFPVFCNINRKFAYRTIFDVVVVWNLIFGFWEKYCHKCNTILLFMLLWSKKRCRQILVTIYFILNFFFSLLVYGIQHWKSEDLLAFWFSLSMQNKRKKNYANIHSFITHSNDIQWSCLVFGSTSKWFPTYIFFFWGKDTKCDHDMQRPKQRLHTQKWFIVMSYFSSLNTHDTPEG